MHLVRRQCVGGAIHVASEQQSNPSTTLITIIAILEGVGLSPLMLATLGFLSTIGQGATESPRLGHGLRLLGVLASVALILTVVGGVKLGDAKTQDDVDSGTKYRHIGVILFLMLYIFVVLLHGFFWSLKDKIMMHRRTLLAGISAVLPFLFIRTIYAVLSGFSPASVPGTPAPHNSLSKFSSTTGSWEIYMAIVPLEKDFIQADMRGGVEDGYRSDQELHPRMYKP
ncbi:hypothetical protein EIP91_009685 [Steccherinum ochraceum]|uniref:DUF7702 domain-containing protein n=1 Tax=Steccherinum ochraceum TaxID=92696 RepID=A0A4R0RXF6_9APHY|nr:hypothetical protein EIP91_009685 [Steccherinum ochraceum]